MTIIGARRASHFQIGDANTVNGSEGIPFVLDSFSVVGHPRPSSREMPLDHDVVHFH